MRSFILWKYCFLLFVSYYYICIESVIPTAEFQIKVSNNNRNVSNYFCSPSTIGNWGMKLQNQYNANWYQLYLLKHSNSQEISNGCNNYTLPISLQEQKNAFILVNRGNCSFLQKVIQAQKSGAKGIAIRDTKETIYQSIVSDISKNSSNPPFQYDCNRGEAYVSKVSIPTWQTDDNSCRYQSSCASNTCILTGNTRRRYENLQYQVCCMWDTNIIMGANQTLAKFANITIPAIYLTVQNGRMLEIEEKHNPNMYIRVYERAVPFLDISTVILWGLGVFTAIIGSFTSILVIKKERVMDNSPRLIHPEDSVAREYNEQDLEETTNDSSVDLEVWEIDTRHAAFFIIWAGLLLCILYYIHFDALLPLLFCVASTFAITLICITPTFEYLWPRLSQWKLNLPVFAIEDTPYSHILGFWISVICTVLWYIHRRTWWVLQDLFGICICFLFFRAVHFPNLKVATLMLSLAFCYDVFFVFITPFIFGSSVMEKVARGGTPASSEPGYPGIDYCERYPTFHACIDPEPMPMLLMLPRLWDWEGGASMLGLGDIIIPGLLLSYVARIDAFKCRHERRYYPIMCIGYAVGLALANVAVILTGLGQPALMYLVPLTLGVLLILSWRYGDLNRMWHGQHSNGTCNQLNDSIEPQYPPISLHTSYHSEELHPQDPSRRPLLG